MENSQNKTITETEDIAKKTGEEDKLLKEVKDIKELLVAEKEKQVSQKEKQVSQKEKQVSQKEKKDMPKVLVGLCCFVPFAVLILYGWSLSYIIKGKKPFYDRNDGLAKGIANVLTFPISIPVWCVCKIKEKHSKKSEEKEPVVQMEQVAEGNTMSGKSETQMEKDDSKEPIKAKEDETNKPKLQNEKQTYIPQEPVKSGEGIGMNNNKS